MYSCVRCRTDVPLEDAVCRSYAFGHCVCLRCYAPDVERGAIISAHLAETVAEIVVAVEERPRRDCRSGVCARCRHDVPADDVAISDGRRLLCLRCLAGLTRSPRAPIRLLPQSLRDAIVDALDGAG
jgi:recombinational DNA repair protein (RecF pathway)